jgi:hypothetical protein
MLREAMWKKLNLEIMKAGDPNHGTAFPDFLPSKSNASSLKNP